MFQKKNFKGYIKIFFIITLVISWQLTGFPPVWLKPRIPPKIKELDAASPETFTTTGTYTAATGIYAVQAECWGGGGAGGGSPDKTGIGGSGGGGGAYSKTNSTSITPGTGYTVTVGTAGNDSYFTVGGAVCLAKAGTAGAASGGTPGSGGGAASGTGDVKKSGGNGFQTTGTSGGGGGGSGGTSLDGNSATSATGATAVSGGGPGGNGGSSGNAGSIPASGYGGGGGGAGERKAGAISGGPGYAGKCIITYTDIWAPSTSQTTYANTWSFSSYPSNDGSSQISMTATTGYDYTATINYLFTLDNTSCGANAGTGGTNSSWQASTSYSDSGLQPNQCYGYTVQSRDGVATPNTGTASSISSTYTSANTPGTPTLTNPSLSTLQLTNDANSNPASNPTTLFAVQVVATSPSDSTWLNKWVDANGDPSATAVWLSDSALDAISLRGLKAGTLYGVKVKAKNQDNDETSLSAEGQGTTTTATISITITSTDNNPFDYGIVALSGTKSTVDLSKTQTAQNTGNVPENFKIKTSNATGGTQWTLGASAGSDIFVHEYSQSGGTWYKFTTPGSYETTSLVSNIAVNGTQDFDLRITLPSITTDYQQKSITVTLMAEQY
ncbi:MAG: hypothetical protein ABIJ05_00065 [Patescibacteria group bacterium]